MHARFPFPLLLLALLVLGSQAFFLPAAHATANAPVPTAADEMAAKQVARMPSDSPPARMVQLLEAMDLGRAALFSLAGLEPLLVEQLVDSKKRAVLQYVSELPATELSELRAGQTVVRSQASWSSLEEEALVEVARTYEIKKPKKLERIRIGNMSGRSMRFELVGKKGEVSTEFADAPTPEREEWAMDRLTAHFGARPPGITSGPGRRLPLEDGSFEEQSSLGTTWELQTAVRRGSGMPQAEVNLDHREVLDGTSSLRFYSDDSTRSWQQVVQRIPVAPGTPLVLRGHVRKHHVVLERDQERRFHVALRFFDASGAPVGQPERTRIDQGDMDWQEVVVRAHAPPEATAVEVVVACTLSGTAWFDGFTLEEDF